MGRQQAVRILSWVATTFLFAATPLNALADEPSAFGMLAATAEHTRLVNLRPQVRTRDEAIELETAIDAALKTYLYQGEAMKNRAGRIAIDWLERAIRKLQRDGGNALYNQELYAALWRARQNIEGQMYLFAPYGTPYYSQCANQPRIAGASGSIAALATHACTGNSCQIILCPPAFRNGDDNLAHILIHEVGHVVNDSHRAHTLEQTQYYGADWLRECWDTWVSLAAQDLAGVSRQSDGYVAGCMFRGLIPAN